MGKIVMTNLNKIEPTHVNEHKEYEYYKYDVTDSNVEKNQTTVAFYSLPPGKSNYPLHYHTSNEEVFYVVSGNGILETSDTKHPVNAGDIMVFPVGSNGTHKLTNTSELENLVYLEVDTNNSPDIVYYPNSNKIGIISVEGYANYSLDSKVDYYFNE